MKRISVFCASGKGVGTIYLDAAYALGKLIATKGYDLVYGGATIGCMGEVARGAKENNGQVIGVLPHFLNKREIAKQDIDQLIMVDSMHERKLKMNELSDGTITLPGGFGTLEEFFEIITWGQLGLHQKPTALLNINGYYDHLVAQLKHMNHEQLLKNKHLNMLIIEENMKSLLERMEKYEHPPIEAWLTDNRT